MTTMLVEAPTDAQLSFYTCPKCRPDREREIDGDPPTREELERLPWLAEQPAQDWNAK